uniref:Minor capsid protein P11 C-terminal conserved region domain-containing protein n=1 Tax=viral metagenome TaxID=1070528 RepID=A0A6C0I2X8_9ZZZZ
MFQEIQEQFSNFFTTQRVIALLVFLVLAWALLSYSKMKMFSMDGMADATIPKQTAGASATPSVVTTIPTASKPTASSGYTMQPVANPADLLPVDQNSQWSALNPNSMNKGDILMPDLLQAGYHIGLDTIGQTLRNPNLQLRSDPLIQKGNVGPWNQSTIEADIGRVPLELGQCSN